MRTMVHVVALAGIQLLLAGCGGGGSDAPAGTAQGLWIGTSNTNRTVTGIVLSDGTYYVLYSAVGNPNLIAGVVQGNGTSSGGTFTSGNARDFNLEGLGVQSANVTANYTQRQSLNGSIAYNVGTTTFASSYSADFEVVPTLATVTGTYTGQVALSVGVQSATVTVLGNGALSGTGGGCAFTGTAAPRTDGNAYNISITFGGSPCLFANQTFVGLAHYDATRRLLRAAAPNASRTDGVLFVGTKP